MTDDQLETVVACAGRPTQAPPRLAAFVNRARGLRDVKGEQLARELPGEPARRWLAISSEPEPTHCVTQVTPLRHIIGVYSRAAEEVVL